MLYSAIMNVCSGIQTKQTNVLRGQNVELPSVKPYKLQKAKFTHRMKFPGCVVYSHDVCDLEAF
jgi:hypothetical protein